MILKPITAGNVSIKVYRIRHSTQKADLYYLAWRQNGKRLTKSFSDESKARAWGFDLASRLDRGLTKTVTPEEAAELHAAQMALTDCKVPLITAVGEYAQLRQLVPNVSIADLAQFWHKHHQGITDKPIGEVVEEMLAQKTLDGRTEAYLQPLRIRLKKFSEAFQCPINHLSAENIQTWLNSLGTGPVGRNEYRRAVLRLCEFAKKRKYLPKDWHEMDAVSIAHQDHGAVQIYTPQAMRQILEAANSIHHPFLAIAAFAGVRTEEILRLTWSDIGHEFLFVSRQKVRTAARRTVPILPNLFSWLERHRANYGQLYQVTAHGITQAVANACRKAGVTPIRNGLRHSYISYRLAIKKDAPAVAIECGTSPQKIFANYREIASEVEANEWFAIYPNGVC